MVLHSSNWRVWLAGIAASLVVFAVVYVAVIKPGNDTASQTVKAGLKQTQQTVSQAATDLSSGVTKAPTVTTAPDGQLRVRSPAALAQCLVGAGNNATAISACHTNFSN